MRIVWAVLKWTAILFVVLVFVGGGAIFLVEIPLVLAFGWIRFLRENLATMEFSPLLWAEAAGCVVALGLGGHWFARWFHREMTPNAPHAWRPAWTVAGLGAVLLLFVAGIATIGITHQAAWLFTAKEPLLRDSWAARMQVSRELSAARPLQDAVTVAHRQTGRLPASDAEAGWTERFEPTQAVLARSIHAGGVVRIEFAESVAGGGILTLTPAPEGDSLKWNCRSTLSRRELPASCRD